MSDTPGWYTDPAEQQHVRCWDGTHWTQHTNAPNGDYAQQLAAAPAQPPSYGAQPAPSNSLATAGMVLGIVGAVIEWAGLLTLAAGVLAIVFGAAGMNRANRLGGLHKGRATAAITLGCVAILAYLLWGIVSLGIFWII